MQKDEFVLYELDQIKYKRQIMNAAKSANFLTDNWQIITLERLYHTKCGRSLMTDVWKISETADRLKYVVEQVEQLTGLENFGVYMCKLLTIDAFFLNEDRHMHNIAVLMNQKGDFTFCPIFDQGAGLLSDTSLDYPLRENVLDMLDEAKGKTICQSFDEALDAAEQLYGHPLQFYFTKKDVNNIINPVTLYSEEEKNRVIEIIFQQLRKYQNLFSY